MMNLDLSELANFSPERWFSFFFRCVRVGEHEVDKKARDKVVHARSLAQRDFKVTRYSGNGGLSS